MESVTPQRSLPHVLIRLVGTLIVLTLLLLIIGLVAVAVGSSGNYLEEMYAWLTGQAELDKMSSTIIWQLRLPRVLLAMLVGASLSLGGLVFQALLRNPLAEPYILGISG